MNVGRAGQRRGTALPGALWRRADYEALFAPAPPGAVRGEATPFYLYDLNARDRLQALIPDAKLILLLRDPVDRAHSNWTHLWNAGLEPETDGRATAGRTGKSAPAPPAVRLPDGSADGAHDLRTEPAY